ncbi:two-component system response regulator KdpE [Undibacterium sp. TS12]|uniref:two-component system response regulator KdpE n=1 Tax=Undibacterium sp. TS12 TaxID=2908202 RepID=UPI001F4CF97C|nr:two-component system response regulator KdpE [Undibacterium sp. TS12]MCH8618278.1 two-component system response regulator KdpE [Undibacterium sp. TS12]
MSEPCNVALLVEDEPQIRRFVRMSLEAEGWQVFTAETMMRGLIDAGTRKPTLIVLDLGLPDGDGLDFIRDVRKWSQVPIIVLSAREEENIKVKALDAGADDYLTKPFGVAELMARVRVALRRQRPSEGDGLIYFGDIKIDLKAKLVSKAGQIVHLTPTEYRLLAVLAANAGRVVSNPQLLREVWGPSNAENGHYLRIFMGRLRQKLEDEPNLPVYLLTETAVGYRLLTAV